MTTTNSVTKSPKIPTKVKIGHFNYTIDTDISRLNICKVKNSQLDITGMTCTEDQIIHIDSSTPLETVQDTLLHEIMHAMFFINSLHNIEKLTEEMIVTVYATNILTMLKENSKVAEFLLERTF